MSNTSLEELWDSLALAQLEAELQFTVHCFPSSADTTACSAERLSQTQVSGLQGVKGSGYIALVGKTCCDKAFASLHLVLFGLQVPETLLVHDLLYLDSVQSDPHQQSLTLQERDHNMVWQFTRVLVLLPVGPWAATTHAL